jgi:hypothetical protein
MEVKIFGMKIRVECVVLCLLIGIFIGGHVLCSCSKIDNIKVGLTERRNCGCSGKCKCGARENFQNLGAPTDYKMGTGVNGSWETRKQKVGPDIPWRSQQMDTYKGTPVPLPEGQMFLFADNQFKPECCGSSVSSSTGCACITRAQMDYVNQRGGNRTACGGGVQQY